MLCTAHDNFLGLANPHMPLSAVVSPRFRRFQGACGDGV